MMRPSSNAGGAALKITACLFFCLFLAMAFAPASYAADGEWSVDQDEVSDQRAHAASDGYGPMDGAHVISVGTKTIRIAVRDKDAGTPLTDCMFDLYAAGDVLAPDGASQLSDGQKAATASTDGTGTATFDQLHNGSYRLVMIRADDGYIQDQSPRAVQITDDEQPTITYELSQNRVRVCAVAAHDPSTAIANTPFQVTPKTPGNAHLAGIHLTNEEGFIELRGAHSGKLMIEQSGPAPRYLIPKSPWRIWVNVHSDGTVDQGEADAQHLKELVFKAPQAQPRLFIEKIDADTGISLSGATFELTDEEGNQIDQWSTNGHPHEIAAIAPGTYTITEIEAPQGYLAIGPIKVTVYDADPVQSLIIENERMPLILIPDVLDPSMGVDGSSDDAAPAPYESEASITGSPSRETGPRSSDGGKIQLPAEPHPVIASPSNSERANAEPIHGDRPQPDTGDESAPLFGVIATLAACVIGFISLIKYRDAEILK